VCGGVCVCEAIFHPHFELVFETFFWTVCTVSGEMPL